MHKYLSRVCYSNGSHLHTSDVVRSLVCVEAGQCDASELGCIDVPASALSEAVSSPSPSPSSLWFTSHGALQRLAHLLTLHHSSAVSLSPSLPPSLSLPLSLSLCVCKYSYTYTMSSIVVWVVHVCF